ncbi:MAG: ATPase, T2SS/T4P/T4SS family [Candidatus Jorgensenbacteria bacterium]
MTDQELLDALVKKGLLDQVSAAGVARDAGLTGRSAEDVLYERRAVEEPSLAAAKSELLGIPYRPTEVEKIPDELLKVIPRETSVTYRVMPLSRERNMLVVGMLRPDDERAQEALRFIAKREGVSLGIYLITPSDLKAMWRRYAPYRSEVETAAKEVGKLPGGESEITSLEEGGSVEDAPIIKIVAATLRQAVEGGASDIHIEPQRSRLRIRFRVDGMLQEVASLPVALTQQILSRVKVLARLKLDENRIPQDGRFRTLIFGRDIDFRVATFPTPSGEKVALRVLDPTVGLKGLGELGLAPYHEAVLKEAIERPFGMILISGPTGSGKTTTLYGIMRQLAKETVNAVSLEDPVEYFMEGVNQSQVKPEIGYTFASGLRQILRQDPDVIMVGEIRDSETADLAVNAALTGHVLLSTLHTNNSVGVIPRLVDLGVPPFLLSSAMNLMLAQRLVLRLCPECRVKGEVARDAERIISEALETLPPSLKAGVKAKPPYTVFRAKPKADCPVCRGKGTAGRVALFELFQMTRTLADLITGGFTEGKLMDEAKRQGMVTLRADGILKALKGDVGIEEVIQETT